MHDVAMTYEAMSNASNQVKAHKESFDKMLSELNSLVSDLEGKWEGAAKKEFQEAFDKLKPTLEKFAELLKQYDTELKTEVTSMQQKDSSGSQRIGANLAID